jgi:hydrogenase nickel incorporation protein HypA/HybF
MHELSLAEAIVGICCEHARGRSVVKVELRVGRLRQVAPDALAFAFQLIAEGTPAEGAELEIEDVPVRVSCASCGVESEIAAFPLACAACGRHGVDVVAGEEFHVQSLEVEDAPVAAARR